MEANGHLDLLVINKNPDASLTEQFNLTGFTPSGQAQVWQYGEAQDYAQSQTSQRRGGAGQFQHRAEPHRQQFQLRLPRLFDDGDRSGAEL